MAGPLWSTSTCAIWTEPAAGRPEGSLTDQVWGKHSMPARSLPSWARFLLSDESRAHPDHKRRCLEADSTVLTELFGLGWADAPHRVIPNAATRRWLREDPRGPRWIRLVNRLASPFAVRLPVAVQDRALAIQWPSQPFLAPPMALDDGPRSLLDSGPLYAGANVTRISDIRPAAQIVDSFTA